MITMSRYDNFRSIHVESSSLLTCVRQCVTLLYMQWPDGIVLENKHRL